MFSMTGYGASRLEEKNLSVFSELRAVNGKYLQIKWALPLILGPFEKHFENLLRKEIKRGSLKVVIQLQYFSEEISTCFNTDLARQVLHTLNSLKQELGVSGEIGFDFLARVPGIFEPIANPVELSEDVFFKIEQTFSEAMEAFQEMRKEEGQSLKEVLLEFVANLEQRLNQIHLRLPLAQKEYHQRLLERVNLLLQESGHVLSEADLAREIAIIAERTNVAEELDRLRSHIEQFRKTCHQPVDAGKKLEFIAQECLREVNTLGNKLQDRESLLFIPEMKLEIDKIKEQCQNIE